MNTRKTVVLLSALLIVGAVIGAFLPLHANGLACGTAFSSGSKEDTAVTQYGDALAHIYAGSDGPSVSYAADCADRRTTQRLIVIPVALIGLAGLAGVVLVARRRSDAVRGVGEGQHHAHL